MASAAIQKKMTLLLLLGEPFLFPLTGSASPEAHDPLPESCPEVTHSSSLPSLNHKTRKTTESAKLAGAKQWRVVLLWGQLLLLCGFPPEDPVEGDTKEAAHKDHWVFPNVDFECHSH